MTEPALSARWYEEAHVMPDRVPAMEVPRDVADITIEAGKIDVAATVDVAFGLERP